MEGWWVFVGESRVIWALRVLSRVELIEFIVPVTRDRVQSLGRGA